ncbi:DUF3667 domain-containing protein [Croceivirga sp. JEA036]|uniref:DUF3667 domain-containing protein n=1 Tax=Croceivirga sp. JEA036 TaxID=2721162 RepID=UPI00143BC02E|nr:DUF3667 domain-containing protein [Croceivirga sp. JEA036]NJB36041.1 DUF3667 domain-containing protein [Croceivirga sp. JEA036]
MEKGDSLLQKGRYDLRYRGVNCLNCGHPLDLSDKYCPNCAQANSTKKLTLLDFVHEFFSSVINYDSKLLRTLYTMLLKPGSITRDYINGKRISYTNPFRFLLSLAFIYFLLATFGNNFEELNEMHLDDKINLNQGWNFNPNHTTAWLDSVKTKALDSLELAQVDSITQHNEAAQARLSDLDSLGFFLQNSLEKERISDSLMIANPRAYAKNLETDPNTGVSEKMEFFITMLKQDSITSYQSALNKYQMQPSLSTKLSFNAARSLLKALTMPGYWLKDTISKLPFVIFFFLPLFTLFIKLAYVRKNYTYTDHLIFSFHNQSLMFILLILSWIIDRIFGTSSVVIFVSLFTIYLFQAMRNFYNQGVLKTIIKYLFLNSVFLFLAIFVVVILFTGSIFTY